MIKEDVFEQLKQAMRDKDSLTKGVLTIVKANLDLQEKENGHINSLEEEIAVIKKEVKQTKQALDGAKLAKRTDLIAIEEQKLELLNQFLPVQFSEKQIQEKLLEAGIKSGMKMGEAMKIAKPALGPNADSGVLAKIVQQLIK